MNKQNIILSSVAFATIVALGSCGTQKSVSVPLAADTVSTVTPSTTAIASVVANKEFISIPEAVSVLDNPDALRTICNKYGYKMITGYGIYRLDSYRQMLYRNCTPAKSMGKGIYADTPQPSKRGTSSYVAVGPGVTIGVFNTKAYQNLVEQVRSLGYTLAEQGYEDRYTNGTVDIYCYGARKTVRIEHSGN